MDLKFQDNTQHMSQLHYSCFTYRFRILVFDLKKKSKPPNTEKPLSHMTVGLLTISGKQFFLQESRCQAQYHMLEKNAWLRRYVKGQEEAKKTVLLCSGRHSTLPASPNQCKEQEKEKQTEPPSMTELTAWSIIAERKTH